MKSKAKQSTILICVTAMFAGLIVGGKAALAVIPNVEVVTLLIAVCAYCWGLVVALPAVGVFILVETTYYGFNTWVLSYVIHWNAVAILFWLLSKIKIKNVALKALVATVSAVAITAMFGVTTSMIDTLIGFVPKKGFFVVWDNFFYRSGITYLNGVAFYVTQVIFNAALFAATFVPLCKVNQKARLRLIDGDNQQVSSPQADEQSESNVAENDLPNDDAKS